MKRCAGVLLAALLSIGWVANSPTGDIQPYGPSGLGDAIAALRLNLAGVGTELKFAGNTVYESDGASTYLSPSDDTNGSVNIYTGGAARFQLTNLGAGRFFTGGSDATPSLNFGSGSGNGILAPSSTSLAFTTNGTRVLTLSSAQAATFAGDVSVAGVLGVTGTATVGNLANNGNSTLVLGKGPSWVSGGAFTQTADGLYTLTDSAGDNSVHLQIGTGTATSGTGALGITFGTRSNANSLNLSKQGADATLAVQTGAGSWATAIASNWGLNGNAGSTLGVSHTGGTTLNLNGAAGGVVANANTFSIVANGAAQIATDAAGTWNYTNVNPNSYYTFTEWDDSQAATQFSIGGASNVTLATPSPAIANPSTIATATAFTSSSTQGGRVCYPFSLGIVKSTTINYKWRHIFYMPAASDGTNTYTAMIGNFVGIGTGTSADLPFGGPYISYTNGTNSGKWVMGSAVNNTRTTGNSSTDPSFSAWSKLEISLANGTYTFIVNGTTIGTLLDSNIATSQASGQAATLGCIAILPTTNYTTARTMAIDRSDFYVTGLSR